LMRFFFVSVGSIYIEYYIFISNCVSQLVSHPIVVNKILC
jgi:hypothetical protein